MPVKRRIAKRRISLEAELSAWEMMFATGYDLCCALKLIGYASEAEARAAAPEAWARLGPAFLERDEQEGERERDGAPWAEEEFGPPG